MKFSLVLLIFVSLIFCEKKINGQVVTMGTLIDELSDFERLTQLPSQPYKYVQFSSYDRRSTKVSEPGWFANSDGFGNEPIPDFEEVLKAPDKDGIGEYLVCDVKGPGAIVRLWTARNYGKIRMYLDGSLVYDGDAAGFFWEIAQKLSNGDVSDDMGKILRQYDATYYPIPFNKSCRIEWVGTIKKLHFYHVGIRMYERPCKVETFKAENVGKYLPNLAKACKALDVSTNSAGNISGAVSINETVKEGSKTVIFKDKGSKAVEYLSFKIWDGNIDKLLRQNILNIYFDGSSIPQVQSPIGDFFGAAPGINPYQSLPFNVYPDGTMECRFCMPYKDSVRIEIKNASGQDVKIEGKIKTRPYKWEDGKSMHFRAKWRINHNITASDSDIIDVPYLLAFGQGRVVGAATYLLNPTQAPTSHGNWWGEGDEKIFVDDDKFPSFFGTGTEDYYNYSWSATSIFSYAYCGQPRNDGPGNRGFVCNYRWHISDDIPFNEKLAFYIELLHHGVVPGFDYGRMVYLYALPDMLDDHMDISMDDIREQHLTGWEPIAFKGSAGYKFYNAEDVVATRTNLTFEENTLWSGDKLLVWSPTQKGEKISFIVPNSLEGVENKMVITFAHFPEGGDVSVYVNSILTKFKGKEILNLFEPYHRVSRKYTSTPLKLKKGENEITIECVGDPTGKKVGIDFIWVKD